MLNYGRAPRSLSFILGIALLLSVSCSDRSDYMPTGSKLIILGFDGVDPDWMNKWMDEGKLPNLQRLKELGDYSELQSTIPPQSPVAWSSFATGTNPGGHGIYDFVKRHPENYMPDVAVMDLQPPELMLGLFPTSSAHGKITRGGTAFWKIAADSGIHSTVLFVPYTFYLHGHRLDLRGVVPTCWRWKISQSQRDQWGGRYLSGNFSSSQEE